MGSRIQQLRKPLLAATCLGVVMLFGLAGCSSRDPRPRTTGQGGSRGATVAVEPAPLLYPWVLWSSATTISGRPINNSDILYGDRFFEEQRFGDAIGAYNDAWKGRLSKDERESLAYRRAATMMAMNKAQDGLEGLSKYFQQMKIAVADLDPVQSVFLGYAYGASGNIGQSLAWFSRGVDGAATIPWVRERARMGVEAVLRVVPPNEFEKVAKRVSSESALRSLVAKERGRRAAAGYVFRGGPAFSLQAFAFQGGADSSLGGGSGSIVPDTTDSRPAVHVLLPLSGKYASLGRQVQRGVELALAEVAPLPASFAFHEMPEVLDDAKALAWRLATEARNEAVLLGPLIADQAEAVSEVSRESRVTNISLSKRASFRTGDSIFRFGITSRGQAESLVRFLERGSLISRVAIAYPADPNGEELASEFRKAVTGRGITVVFDSSYPRGQVASVEQLAQKLESSSAQAVFIPDSVEMAARFLGALTPEARSRIKALGAAIWENPKDLVRSQNLMDGVVFVTGFNRRSTRAIVTQFVERYRSTYGEEPDFLAAQGYDAAKLLLEASRLRQSRGGTFTEAIRELRPFEGLTGKIRVEPDGEIARDYGVVSFVGGNFTEALGAEGVAPVPGSSAPGSTSSLFAPSPRLDNEQAGASVWVDGAPEGR